MAGIYIHIPYCRQACRYCDFHFEISTWHRKELIPAMLQEIRERKEYLGNELIETIYFGGGTPSILDNIEVEDFIRTIKLYYKVADDAEVSFEANPEDLSTGYLEGLKKAGINRLSIGTQSFFDSDLELMHRIHDSKKAILAIQDSQNAGFGNISIDLIYGLPGQPDGVWEKNLEIALSMGVQHFSAYHLTYEAGTIFEHWRKKGRIKAVNEEVSLRQFSILLSKAIPKGFEHYEISNFALPGYQSKHNKGYWQQKKYLGVGPSAHSYDGKARRWNIKSNKKYIEGVTSGENYYEIEYLTSEDHFNEYIMTSLRTNLGADMIIIEERFGKEKAEYFQKKIKKYVKSGKIIPQESRYRLSQEGIFISDLIISDTFI